MSRQAIEERIRAKLNARVQLRATDVSQSAASFHINAPRGGHNLNMFGQRRSAAGEQPAIETGQLLMRIQNPDRGELWARVVVNYAKLEFGYDGELGRVEPRPQGRMVLAEILAGGQW